MGEPSSPGDSLIREREIRNTHDTHAVAIKANLTAVDSAGVTVARTAGHVPTIISAVFPIFITYGGTIFCVANGAHHYFADVPQGEPEILIYKFITKTENEAKKAKAGICIKYQ